MPDGTALDKAREVAATVAGNGPLAVEAILKTLRATEHMSEEEAFAFEQPIGMAVMASADSKEGPKAFAEKRTPELPAEVSPDPRTPVLVGAGVAHQRFDDPAEALDAVTLMTTAVERAGADAHAPALLAQAQAVYVPRGTWRYARPRSDHRRARRAPRRAR